IQSVCGAPREERREAVLCNDLLGCVTVESGAEWAERSGRSSYYDAEGVTLYLGDCLEVLRDMPKVDAVITDPPYNVGLQYGAGVDDAKANYAQWCAQWFGLLKADRIAISVGVANMTMWDA
ncbi:hypothetical protein OEZ84_29195, partial [Leclercia adecarboxylata]|nr:hypothetical protein [Leclercia adecarboxylata]